MLASPDPTPSRRMFTTVHRFPVRLAGATVLAAVLGAGGCSPRDRAPAAAPSDAAELDDASRDAVSGDAADLGDGDDTTSGTATAAPLTAVRGDGRQGTFVDPLGREVLLRGVNVNSFAEYWQYDPDVPATFPFTMDDADVIAGMGFNLVRLLLTWSRVEPEAGAYDAAYIETIRGVIDLLAERGIYTLIDLHQDAWGPTLAAREGEGCTETEFAAGGWDGAPGWATLVDDATSRCIPLVGGRHLRELSPAVQEAWAAFLANAPGPGDVGLQDRFASMLGHLAHELGPRSGVIGYDIINEPNAMFGPEQLRGLADLYDRALAAIREGERRAGVAHRVVVFEPSALWPNLPAGSTVAAFSDDPQLAYGPHIYQGSISPVPLGPDQVRRIRDEAVAYGGVPILCGEWGDNPDQAARDDAYIHTAIALQDEEKWGMAFWVYQSACGDPHYYAAWLSGDLSGQSGHAWGLRDFDCSGEPTLGAFRQPQYDTLARPALHFAPGSIDRLAWDRAGGVLTASGSDAIAGLTAVLFLPDAHAERPVAATGFGPATTEPAWGGIRWSADAIGGAWTITVGP